MESNRRLSQYLLWWIIVILLSLSLTRCNRIVSTPVPPPEMPAESKVGELSASRATLSAGETADLRVAVVKVLGAEEPFEFQWSTTGGLILFGQGTCCVTYQAPETPGAYEVHLTVKLNNQMVQRSLVLQVTAPTVTVEPSPTPSPAPPAEPTATPVPTDIPLPDAIAYFQRAEAYYFKRDYERTIADYTKAIELNYDPLSDPYYNRGYVYYVQQDYTQAIADFTKAIELNYDPASVPYYNRANAHFYKGNNDHAIADYTRAIELNANPLSWVYNNRGLAYRKRGEYDLAVADYTKAIELKHDPPQWPYYNRGNAYADQGEYERAINDYNEALRLDPTIVDAYYQRGLAYKHQGDFNAARADFNKVLELATDSLRDQAEAQLQELGAP